MAVLISVDAKSFDYKAVAELFRLEAENSIVSSPIPRLSARRGAGGAIEYCRHSCSGATSSRGGAVRQQ